MNDTDTTLNGNESRVSPYPDHTVASAEAAALAELEDRWKPHYFELESLPQSAAWARSVRAKYERKNAIRNPTVDSPELYVNGVECVQKGATASDMDALHSLTFPEIAALRMRGAAVRKDAQRRADEMAQELARNVPALDLAAEVLTVSGLAGIEPVRPLIVGFLARGQLADLNGAPGTGKTMAAVGMAAAIASGKRWCGHAVPERAPVLYVAAEGASGIRARLLAWCEVNGVDPASIDDTFLIAPRAVQMGDDGHMEQVRELVAGHKVALVVFDTRARCTVGVEENSATEHGKVIGRADDISQQTGAAVLVVHHTAAGSDRARGTTAWDGAVWSSLLLTRAGGKKSKKSSNVTITATKHKEWPDGRGHDFKLVEHTVSESLMANATASQRSTLVLTGIDPAAVMDETQTTSEKHAAILAIVAEMGGGEGLTRADIVKFAGERGLGGQSTVYAALATMHDKTKQLVKVAGTQRLAARELIDGVTDATNSITTVGSPLHTAAVDQIILDLCARKAEGEVTDGMTKADVHKVVGGHGVPFATAYAWWDDAARPSNPDLVNKIRPKRSGGAS